MTASAFGSVTPTWVYPLEPQYHNVVTQAESMKKRYYNVSGSSVAQYKLVFEGLSDAQHTTLKNHFNECKGGYDSFTWQTVPSYIGTDMVGRWVEGSFKEDPKSRHWECEIIFEVDIP